jgi:hypothetical protein
LKPLAVAKETGTYFDIARWLQVNENGMVCNTQKLLPGAGVTNFPADIKAYNMDALVAAIGKFVELTKSVAELVGVSFRWSNSLRTQCASFRPMIRPLRVATPGSSSPQPFSIHP